MRSAKCLACGQMRLEKDFGLPHVESTPLFFLKERLISDKR